MAVTIPNDYSSANFELRKHGQLLMGDPNTISDFVELIASISGMLMRVSAACRSGDVASFDRLLHELRALAWYVGADEVRALCDATLTDLRNAVPVFLPYRHYKLVQSYARFLRVLDTVWQSGAPTGSFRHSDAGLSRLRPATA